MKYYPTLLPNTGWDQRIQIVRYGSLVDVCIVVTERAVILLDTLDSPEAALALLDLARPHLAGRQLLAVNTHSHYDHAWGNQIFVGPDAALAAPVIATRRCAEMLRGPEAAAELARMAAAEPEDFGAVRLTAPTISFAGELTIDGGDLTLHLLATPGHAPDHVAVWIPEIALLWAGDAAEAPFPLVDTAATLPVLRDSLRRMAALEPRSAFYCHAPLDAGPELLRRNLAYFDLLEARCRAALAVGAPDAPTTDADLETLVGFSFAEACSGVVATQPEFYQPQHHNAIRVMLEWLSTG